MIPCESSDHAWIIRGVAGGWITKSPSADRLLYLRSLGTGLRRSVAGWAATGGQRPPRAASNDVRQMCVLQSALIQVS